MLKKDAINWVDRDGLRSEGLEELILLTGVAERVINYMYEGEKWGPQTRPHQLVASKELLQFSYDVFGLNPIRTRVTGNPSDIR